MALKHQIGIEFFELPPPTIIQTFDRIVRFKQLVQIPYAILSKLFLQRLNGENM